MNPTLTVNRIEFVVTYRCNAHCAHCQVDDETRRSRPASIEPDLAARIVRRLCEAYQPGSVMTFGGEPLLYPDAVCAVHTAARDCGIPSRSIITNAGVPRLAASARALARRLAHSGVNAVIVSVDGFHQEHIPVEIVERNIAYMVEAGIPELKWNPCWLVDRDDDNPWNRKTRDVLRALAHLPVPEHSGNVVQPDGHAARNLGDYMPPRVPLPKGTCGDMPYTGRLDEVSCISIEPDGGVSVCRDFVIGHAGERDVLEILRNYDPYADPKMHALLEGGVPALAEMARSRGIEPDPGGYYNVCDACCALRKALATS
jgi:hypothetical protein